MLGLMCSRYELSAAPHGIARRFDLFEAPAGGERAEIRPTDAALIIGIGRKPYLRRFGLEMPWDPGKPLLNARGETLGHAPTFRDYLQKRCLVPATAYFEWRAAGRRRIKHRIAVDDGEMVAFAGIFDETSFAIVTCAPAPSIAHIHDRMPVILAKEAEARWIAPVLPFAAVQALLVPYGGSGLDAREDRTPPPQLDLFSGGT